MIQRIKELLFTNRSTRQTIVKNTIWLTVSMVLGRVIRAGVIIYAARVLGAEGYGVFSYAMSLAAFFSLFSDMGLTGLTTREVAKHPEEKSGYIATVSVIKAFVLVFTLFLTLALSPFFVKISAAAPLIPLAAILVLFDNLRVFGFGFARAGNKMEYEGLLSLATDIIITIAGLAILFVSPTPFALSLMYVLGSIAGTILTFLVLRKHIFSLIGKFNRALVKPILSVAIPFAIMNVFGALMINIDMVILGFFRDAYELGLYAASQRPVQLLYVLPGLIAASVFPIVSRLATGNESSSAKRIVEMSVIGTLMAALPIAIGGIILGTPIMFLLFGTEYTSVTLAFQLLLLTILFVFPGTVIGNSIFSYNLQKILMWTTGLGAAANIALDFLLIPQYGIEGSAIATVISVIFANGANWYFLKRRTGFSVLPGMKRILAASLLMGAFTYGLSLVDTHVLLNVALSALVYLGALLIFREPLVEHARKTLPGFRNFA